MYWSNFIIFYLIYLILNIIYSKKKELVDMATVSDQEIKNDDIVYMVFVKETGSGFEEIAVDNLVPFGDDDNKGIWY